MPNLRFLRIPRELQSRPQWAVATLTPKADGKPDKAPRNPLTGNLASSTDPRTWCTFEEAVNSGYPAIGFMLSAGDPFAIIDLDSHKTVDRQSVPITEDDRARQLKIYGAFESYAERSQSGKGAHIIVKGIIRGGTNRDGIEVYDQERFMLCTGDVIRDAPIMEYQELLDRVVAEMGGVRSEIELPSDHPERMSDQEIMDKLLNAKNADKFKDLYYNRPGPGDDWSQRDASLAQFIAFYTRNHEQALRLFRGSALYRPNDKGKNPEHYESYYLLGKTFARAWVAEGRKDADIEHGRQLAEQLMASEAQRSKSQEQIDPSDRLPMPPGLVGDIAKFILGSAQRPVPEIAIAGALTFCSGLLGRQFNVSNTGLNLYIVLLAETGRGKEAAAAGVDMLLSALRPKMPAVDEYQGPGHIASGQGLVKHMSNHPACFSFLSEFGHLLKIITNPRANAADLRTKQVMLDLFSKSGQYQTMHSSAYSDQEKNTKSVQAPCFAFMGDTVPESYYDSVNEKLISEGLIPRFQTITYDGPRVPRNRAPIISPDQELVDRLITLFTSLANMYHSGTFTEVGQTPEATAMLDQFDQECDDRINSHASLAEMWNRAHLKVLRIAALIAVGKNHFAPMMEAEDVEWAQRLVVSEIDRLEERFHTGKVGEGEVTYEGKVADAVRDYLAMSTARKEATYKVPKALIDEPHLIPYTYFRRRLKNHADFAHARQGLVNAIKGALQDACDMGLLQKLSPEQVAEISVKYAGKAGRPISGDIYAVGGSFS